MAVRFVFDEHFSELLARGFRAVGFLAERVPARQRDEITIEDVADTDGPAIWITKDVDAADDHRRVIERSGASIAFLRPGNPSPTQTAFLTISFMYRFEDEVAANPGSYYVIRERRAEGRPRAVINRIASLDDLRVPIGGHRGRGRKRRRRAR